ncbi:Na+/melibiose symporter-like transporter [Pseudonocardia sediminis]|uniref:Na+/melibiose symporter-like transporter n=1 Tax=Pseudonocardia sediminis TaxID=1397368 RepID=A0A4Q7V0B9_PSEST|nr:MFS transporter [Pseudonocardia sediminis]RZT86848.1 Na+/melibiose symporter-like transporter [Pseudonocardia sediminis]
MALCPRVRRGYALGSVATGTFGTVPGLLLLPYLTDTLGVAAVVAGLIVFVPKAWDVVLNPIAGRISDRSTSPIGRRRPFLLRAGLVLAVTFALIFAGPSGPPSLAAVWVLLAFLLCATAYAFFQVPFNAMPAEITSDAGERTRMMTWRVAVIAVAILLSGATAPLIVSSYGHAAMGVYVGVLLLLGTVGAYLATAGVVEEPVATAEGPLREQLRVVLAEPDFRRLMLAFVVQSLGVGALLAGVAYVARYLLSDPAASSVLFVAFVGPALLVSPLWERWAARRGKREGYLAATVVLVVGTLALWTVTGDVAWPAYVAAGIAGVGYAGTQVFPLAMLPDVAAASTRASGVNRVGVFTGLWTAGETLGLALGPGLYALVLAVGGYAASTGGTAQPPSALTAIAVGFTLVPAVLIAVSLLPLRRYSLDERVPHV